jgi:hypothetical protein
MYKIPQGPTQMTVTDIHRLWFVMPTLRRRGNNTAAVVVYDVWR